MWRRSIFGTLYIHFGCAYGPHKVSGLESPHRRGEGGGGGGGWKRGSSPPLVQFSPTPAISSLCCLNNLLVSLQVHVEMKQQQHTRTHTHTRAGTVRGGGASQAPCPCQTPFQQCHCSTCLCAFSVSRRAWGWFRNV